MKIHKTNLKCPICGGRASLTTEWGWVNDDTCTAVLCCPNCRSTPPGAAIEISHVQMIRDTNADSLAEQLPPGDERYNSKREANQAARELTERVALSSIDVGYWLEQMTVHYT